MKETSLTYHIVAVTIDANHVILVTTSAGSQIRIPASESVISQFTEELANCVQSNFVSITHPRPSNRFVDQGSRFHHGHLKKERRKGADGERKLDGLKPSSL